MSPSFLVASIDCCIVRNTEVEVEERRTETRMGMGGGVASGCKLAFSGLTVVQVYICLPSVSAPYCRKTYAPSPDCLQVEMQTSEVDRELKCLARLSHHGSNRT